MAWDTKRACLRAGDGRVMGVFLLQGNVDIIKDNNVVANLEVGAKRGAGCVFGRASVGVIEMQARGEEGKNSFRRLDENISPKAQNGPKVFQRQLEIPGCPFCSTVKIKRPKAGLEGTSSKKNASQRTSSKLANRS